MRKMLALIAVVIATGCGTEPASDLASGSSAQIGRPTCEDGADADKLCDRCLARFTDSTEDGSLTGPPCRFKGRAYNLSLSCGSNSSMFDVGWVGDGEFAVLFQSDPELYFTARVSDAWGADIIDWRGADGAAHGVFGFFTIAGGGVGLEFFLTPRPDFEIGGCAVQNLRSTFDATASVPGEIENRAREILAELSGS